MTVVGGFSDSNEEAAGSGAVVGVLPLGLALALTMTFTAAVALGVGAITRADVLAKMQYWQQQMTTAGANNDPNAWARALQQYHFWLQQLEKFGGRTPPPPVWPPQWPPVP